MQNVIIVLGGGINANGSLKKPSELRIQKAVELFKKQQATKLIPTSKWAFVLDFTPASTIADAMKKYAVAAGISTDQVLAENSSVDTIGNAYFTKVQFLEPNNWKKVTIVTSRYHMRRSEYLFKKILGPEYEIQFVATGNGVPFYRLFYQIKVEKKLLTLSKLLLDPIADGDHDAVRHTLYTKHPGYATNPEYSLDQLFKMTKKQFHHKM